MTNATAVIRGLLAIGKPFNQVVARINDQFPQLANNTVRAGVKRVAEAGYAARQLQAAQLDQAIYRDQIPINPAISQAYQYGVVMSWRNPDTGERFEKYVPVPAGGQLTHGELQDQAENVLAEQFANRPDRTRESDPQHAELLTMRIVSIYRRT